MSRDLVQSICAPLPGAECSDPWGGGHDAWKVGGKMFACVGAVQAGVSVKTESIEQAQFLIETGRGEKAAYFHRSWLFIPWGLVPDDEVKDRIEASYRIIFSGLTKKRQREIAG